jgi:hypothetical protein
MMNTLSLILAGMNLAASIYIYLEKRDMDYRFVSFLYLCIAGLVLVDALS